jgi:hypothetical protein
MTASQNDVDHLAEITSDAYSFDRYASWRACVTLLARRGYSYAECEWILRSKWVRWAGDRSHNRYGRCTSGDLARFLDTCRECSTENLHSMMAEND